MEVVSPDSEARDRDTKPHKYAAAGIPHFWLVELAEANQQPPVRTYELDPVTKTYGFTGTHRDLLKVGVPYGIGIDITPEALDAL
ncbi:Uma2 family endonuclease [Streptomyces achromogenes]|nr:Uma2 family endonuclease [Streptomyces achromogenes]